MIKFIIQVTFFFCLIFHFTNGRPAESHIQPAEGPTRAKFLLDALSTFTNAQKTAVSGSRAVGEGIDVAQEIFVENTNSIVGNGKNAIDTDTKAVGDSFKAAADMGGQFANTAAVLFLSLPKFFATSAQAMFGAGGDSK
ncbi:uncharacterized protein LOC123294658 [Chrysoperla carnea]|uniref:uncharacterized protein LOC123294658 n=1 Tax=Chrysoperla carnea TaxID=189513 RepID=UPI001D07729D|nr:uncharacterized protein LOC123294658 [Chrysoperla carnea]